MGEFRSGYHGEDSMRDKAERMFREEDREMGREVPGSYSARSREKTRFYAKGGHVEGREERHRMEKSQHDMKIPRTAKTPKLNVENMEEVERMRRGGKTHHRHRAEGGKMAEGGAYAHGGRVRHKADGGMMQNAYQNNMANNSLNSMASNAMGSAAMKRGGHARKKHHYADGGLVNGMPQEMLAKAMMEAAKAQGPMTNVNRFAVMPQQAMKRGGKVRHRAEGGKMADGGLADAIRADAARRQADAAKGIPQIGVYNPRMPQQAMKKGGKAHRRADGGAMAEGGQSAMRKGGRTHHRADGGRMADGGKMATGGSEAMKRGGHSKKHHHKKDCYAHGGAVSNHYGRYEADMMGEHHGARNHYRDYTADMMGEHGCHEPSMHSHIGRSKGTPFAEGGYAMGGVGKYRHGEATKSGKQIGHKGAKGSPFA